MEDIHQYGANFNMLVLGEDNYCPWGLDEPNLKGISLTDEKCIFKHVFENLRTVQLLARHHFCPPLG
jgi:hypothetical protein